MSEERLIVKKILHVSYVILISLLCFGFYNIYDRRAKTDEIKSAQTLQRSMLNARARIQIILLNANLEGRKLSPQEVDQIQTLWKKAEYDQAEGR